MKTQSSAQINVEAGLPVATITYNGETVYEYADGSIRRNAGSGKWVKLTKAEKAMLEPLKRTIQNKDTRLLDASLQIAIEQLLGESITVQRGVLTPNGFRAVDSLSMYSVLVEITDPEGALTLHLQHDTRHHLEVGAAELTGLTTEGCTLAAIICSMLEAGRLS